MSPSAASSGGTEQRCESKEEVEGTVGEIVREELGLQVVKASKLEERELTVEDDQSRRRRRRRRWWWRPLCGLALGQFLSLLITATGVASSRLASLGIHAPTTQSLCNYVLLALIYGSVVLYQRRKIQVRWYYFALLAIVDVEANYLVVKAYQYTSITSILLLDKGSLLFVLVLTWIILKTKHNLGQLGGVIICVVGVLVLFLSDITPTIKKDAKELVKGDVMVLIASFLYAVSNVIEELLLRNVDFLELTAWLGLFGSFFSSCQLCILEIHEIKSIKWNVYEVLPFLGYAASLFTFYTMVPIFLKLNGSTSLNLSLITSDLYATSVKRFLYHQKIEPLYFVALSIVIVGLITHSAFSSSSNNNSSSQTMQHSVELFPEQSFENRHYKTHSNKDMANV